MHICKLKKYKKDISLLLIIAGSFFISLLHTNPAFSQDINKNTEQENSINISYITPKKAEGLIIASIELVGNNKTNDDIIEDNIELKEESIFTVEKLKTSLQNLKNLQVFSKIDVKLSLNKNNQIIIVFELDEKWTLLPYFLAGSGGGTSYLVLGLYETNFIGRLYTFNFTYGCKNDNCSTFVYFRNPSVLGSRFNLVNYMTREHNIFHTYNKNREVTGTFANKRDMLNLFTDIKITPTLFLGFGALYLKNDVTDDGINSSDTSTNKKNSYNFPPSSSSVALEGRLTLGKINYDGMKVEGVNFVSILDTTAESYKAQNDNYSSLNSTLQFYHPNINLGLFTIPLPRLSYLAIRSNISVTSSDVLSQQYFIGGLDKIRGFYDGEFSGKFSYFSNFELRIPSYVNDYIAIQHALFSDVGYASNTFPDIFSNYTGVSVGTGIRILPLKVNRVALRIDCAYTLNPFHTYGFNFGLLQFF